MALLSWINPRQVRAAAQDDAEHLRVRFGATAELFCDAALESPDASPRQLRHLRMIRRALDNLPSADLLAPRKARRAA
jgi:hypothetical protein